MQGFELTKECLAMMQLVLEHMKVNTANCAKAMTPELFSVEKTHQLVKQGVAFRDAYAQVNEEYS